MPAGKSPNNAFNLHKKHMNHVFRDICGGRAAFLAPTLIPSCRASRTPLVTSLILHHPFSSNDQQSSKPYFYWKIHHSEDQWELYSKGYIMTSGGGIWSGRCEGCFNTTTASITGDGDDVNGGSHTYGGRCERDGGIRFLITKVREYYTDGVRAIGEIE